MKNSLSFLRLALVSAWLIASLACGEASRSDGNSSSGSANSAASNASGPATNAPPTVNKRDPKRVCAYFLDFNVLGDYKSSGSGYSCNNSTSHTLPSGRTQLYRYSADGDAENIKRVSLSTLGNSKYEDAGAGDDFLVEKGDELWQKVFAAPLPNEIKEAILTNKGKNVKTEKRFTEPTAVTVSRSPGGGETYSLSLDVTLPQ